MAKTNALGQVLYRVDLTQDELRSILKALASMDGQLKDIAKAQGWRDSELAATRADYTTAFKSVFTQTPKAVVKDYLAVKGAKE